MKIRVEYIRHVFTDGIHVDNFFLGFFVFFGAVVLFLLTLALLISLFYFQPIPVSTSTPLEGMPARGLEATNNEGINVVVVVVCILIVLGYFLCRRLFS